MTPKIECNCCIYANDDFIPFEIINGNSMFGCLLEKKFTRKSMEIEQIVLFACVMN